MASAYPRNSSTTEAKSVFVARKPSFPTGTVADLSGTAYYDRPSMAGHAVKGGQMNVGGAPPDARPPEGGHAEVRSTEASR